MAAQTPAQRRVHADRPATAMVTSPADHRRVHRVGIASDPDVATPSPYLLGTESAAEARAHRGAGLVIARGRLRDRGSIAANRDEDVSRSVRDAAKLHFRWPRPRPLRHVRRPAVFTEQLDRFLADRRRRARSRFPAE